MLQRVPAFLANTPGCELRNLFQADRPAHAKVRRCERALCAQKTTRASGRFPRARSQRVFRSLNFAQQRNIPWNSDALAKNSSMVEIF